MAKMRCTKCEGTIACSDLLTFDCYCTGWVAGQHEWPEHWSSTGKKKRRRK